MCRDYAGFLKTDTGRCFIAPAGAVRRPIWPYNPPVETNPDPDIELGISSLRHPDSAKWNHYPTDVLPLWVADMDFEIAHSIKAALIERAGRPLGYHIFNDPLLSMLREKLHRTGYPTIPDRGIAFVSGVVQ